MHRLTNSTFCGLFLSAIAFSAYALPSTEVVIPEKVKANILKRHPKAVDLQASHEVHFKRHLLEVSFKEEGNPDPVLELFREDGNLFGNEIPMSDLGEAPVAIKEAVEKNFPGFIHKKSELIGNPNGAGEEYEVYLTVGGVNWKVSISENGTIESKEQY